MVIHKIRHHLAKYHKWRKRKDDLLPKWKEQWNRFNEKYLFWLEKFVDWMLPWLVFLLLGIIIGEYAHYINYFQWKWIETMTIFFEDHIAPIAYLDHIITAFFAADIYFNFFKKRTFWMFLKTSFIDILAIAPLGLIFRVSGLTEAQSLIHVTAEAEKEAGQLVKEGEEIGKITREIAKSEEITKIAKEVEKVPKTLRLYKLSELEKKKKQRKHSKKIS